MAEQQPPIEQQSPMGSVDKALLALVELSHAGGTGLSLGALSEALGLNKTSLHRTLAALRFRGFVDQRPDTGTYVLGPATAALASAYLADENLPALLRPCLTALCASTDELVHLGVLTGAEVVYLDKVEPARPVRVWSSVGARRPAATTALGRAILSHAEPGGGDATRPLRVPGSDLATILAGAHERGYATEDQENEAGISCLAVPLLRDGRPVAAMSITAPAERMDPARHAALVTTIVATAPPLLPAGITLPAVLLGELAPAAGTAPPTWP